MAQQRGAIGVILYIDPFDAAPEGEKFIKGRWLPDDGIQRGSILNINGGGDPLTLGYPSKGKTKANSTTRQCSCN